MRTFGFGTLGRLAMLGIVAPGFYLVISQGAAERAKVEAVERSIVQARKDIRDLETEFDTRANMAQLERWNGDVLALAAPRAEQFVGGEHQLASLPGRTEGGNVALAYVVPAAPIDYVAPVVIAPADPAAPKVPVATAPVQAASAPARPSTRTQAVAMLDRTLLGSGGAATGPVRAVGKAATLR